MLNTHARGFFTRVMNPLAKKLVDAGISPDLITVVGTLGAVTGALVFFTRGVWFIGTLVIWGSVMLDLLDGVVARMSGRTSTFGAVLDSTCDRIADAAVFGCIAWYFAKHYQPWMIAGCLLCLVLGSLTSYIRARAEGAGLTASVGIAERAERLIIVLVGTGLTGSPFGLQYIQAIALWLLVGASTITVCQRLGTVWRQTHPSDRTADV